MSSWNHSAYAFPRASELIPIPENQVELDTPSDTLIYTMVILNGISCLMGTVGNVMTISVVAIRWEKIPSDNLNINNYFIYPERKVLGSDDDVQVMWFMIQSQIMKAETQL